jgi:Flp pilus assembly pilin Flp
MLKLMRNFWFDDDGQDLIEYTLLLAFVALASAALFMGVGGNVNGVWDEGSEVLHHANTASS